MGRIHLSRPRPDRPGWRSWAPVTRRARHRWFSHQLWTPLDFPGSSRLGWRRHKRRDRRRQFSCRFWFPLGRPWRAWLLPSRPLPPLVSINQRDRALAATEGNTELGQLAKSRQHRPQGGGGEGGGGGEKQCRFRASCYLGEYYLWNDLTWKGRETVFTCLYPYTVQTRPLAGTASGMASDSVRGRGNICGADLEIKSKRGDGTLLIFEASA